MDLSEKSAELARLVVLYRENETEWAKQSKAHRQVMDGMDARIMQLARDVQGRQGDLPIYGEVEVEPSAMVPAEPTEVTESEEA